MSILLGILRHFLTFGGGALLTKGIAHEDPAQSVTAAVITLVGAGWSIAAKRKKK